MDRIRYWLELTDLGQVILAWPFWAFPTTILVLGLTSVLLRSVPVGALPRAVYFAGSVSLILLAGAHSFEALGVTLVTFLVTAIPIAALVSPSKPRILLLRRFHSESGRTAISALFDRLTLEGFDCVTLADSQVNRDRITVFGLTSLMAGIVVLTAYVIVFAAIFLLLFDPLYALGFAAFAAFSVAIFAVAALLFAIIGIRQVTALSAWLTEKFIQPRFAANFIDASGAVVLPARLRKPWQGGLAVLLTTDSDWRPVVLELLRSSHRICVDLYAPSDNLVEELRFIQQLEISNKVIWLEPDDEQCIAVEPGGYVVLGLRFSGKPRLWRYPAQGIDSDLLGGGGHALGGLVVRFRHEMLNDLRYMVS